VSGFTQFHELCSHVTMGHILGSMVWAFGANRFLALAKSFDDIHLIVMGELFY